MPTGLPGARASQPTAHAQLPGGQPPMSGCRAQQRGRCPALPGPSAAGGSVGAKPRALPLACCSWLHRAGASGRRAVGPAGGGASGAQVGGPPLLPAPSCSPRAGAPRQGCRGCFGQEVDGEAAGVVLGCAHGLPGLPGAETVHASVRGLGPIADARAPRSRCRGPSLPRGCVCPRGGAAHWSGCPSTRRASSGPLR